MTEIPDWVTAVPAAPVHDLDITGGTQLTRPFTRQQLLEIGEQFLEQFIKRVVQAVTGIFLPDIPAFDQLYDFFQDMDLPGLDALNLGTLLSGFTGDNSILNQLIGLIPGVGSGLSGLPGLGSVITDWTGLLGAPTGLGTGTPALPGIGSIPILGGLLSGGLLSGGLIPGLDASKIISGNFGAGLLQPVIDAVSQGFGGSTGLGFSGLQSFLSGLEFAGISFDDLIGLIPGTTGGLSGETGLTSIITDWIGLLGSPTGLGGGTPTLPGVTSIPLLGGLLSGGTFLSSLIPSLDASKITTGTIDEAVTTIGDLRDSLVSGLFGGLLGSGFSNNDAQMQATVVAQTAAAAAAAAAAAQEQLAQQDQTGSSGNGTNFRTSFGGAEGANLNSADWNPYNTNILIGTNGAMGIKGNLSDGVYATTCQHPCVTTDQRVSVVLGSYGGSELAPVRVVWHLPTSTSTNGGACMIIAKDRVQFGFLSGTNVFTQIGSTYSATLGQGARIECINVGSSFTVNVNSLPKIVTTDSGGLITLGGKYAAAHMTRLTTSSGWFGITTTYDCFQLSSFGLADYTTAIEANVDAWKIGRPSTLDITLSIINQASANFPASFFTATDYVNGATVTTLGTGVVTIATTGLYEITCSVGGRLRTSATTDTYIAFPWGVSVNGALATGAIPSGVSQVVFLDAGDTVQPMAVAVGDTQFWDGTAHEMACEALTGPAHFSGRQILTA